MQKEIGKLGVFFELQDAVNVKLVSYETEAYTLDSLSSSPGSASASPSGSPVLLSRALRSRSSSADAPKKRQSGKRSSRTIEAISCYIESEKTFGTSGDALCVTRADALQAACNDFMGILRRFDGDEEAVAGIRPLRGASAPVACPPRTKARSRSLFNPLNLLRRNNSRQ